MAPKSRGLGAETGLTREAFAGRHLCVDAEEKPSLAFHLKRSCSSIVGIELEPRLKTTKKNEKTRKR